MNKRTLKLLGYWTDGEGSGPYIHPHAVIDPHWAAGERRQIVEYLKQGIRVHEDLGFSYCRFPSGPVDKDMGNAERTDGEWIWPEGLWVYVANFGVRLPDDILATMRANRFSIPAGLDAKALDETPVDESFWRSWCKSSRPSILKKTQISGLIGMVVGGAALAYQFKQHGGNLKPLDWAFPAILIVLGVLYFLAGEFINGSKKKPDKSKPSE